MSHPSPTRARDIQRVLEKIRGASRVVLTTHVNADGDGVGSEIAVASWLRASGREAWIVNPTRFPRVFEFVLERPQQVVSATDTDVQEVTARADLAIVLDTSEFQRIGRVKPLIDHLPKVVIDHHVPGTAPIGGTVVRDASACATGELVYDLIEASGDGWTRAARLGVYVAILTDTGGFRFANSSPAAHRVAAAMIEGGVKPEDVQGRIYGNAPLRKFQLLAASLQMLDVDEEAGIAWMTVPRDVHEQVSASPEDIDGFVDYPRSVAGTRVALLFRETSSGGIKVSFRSTGNVDVNELAKQFGGGGHVRASGALVSGTLEDVRRRVLDAVRAATRT